MKQCYWLAADGITHSLSIRTCSQEASLKWKKQSVQTGLFNLQMTRQCYVDIKN